MKIGVSMAFNHFTPPAFIGAAAQAVEAAGFDAIWLPEHVIFFPEYQSRYPIQKTAAFRASRRAFSTPSRP